MSGVKVIGVFGLSGVGKTRLIKAASEGLDGVLHLQASALIKEGLADASVTSEALRRSSGDQVLANQQVLLTMFERSVAAKASKLVVFDGHLIIDTDAEIIEIPLDVIAGLRPSALVHVEAPREVVVKRRRQDEKRTRPDRTPAVLGIQQERSREVCRQHAAALGIDMQILDDDAHGRLAALCRALLDES